MTLKARVHNGRLVLDEPTQLPEGTEVELLPLNPGKWLGAVDRAALYQTLLAYREDVRAGHPASAEEARGELREAGMLPVAWEADPVTALEDLLVWSSPEWEEVRRRISETDLDDRSQWSEPINDDPLAHFRSKIQRDPPQQARLREKPPAR